LLETGLCICLITVAYLILIAVKIKRGSKFFFNINETLVNEL